MQVIYPPNNLTRRGTISKPLIELPTCSHGFESDLPIVAMAFIFSANFGGTVGLCIGFSLLSLAEIFYFFSMRPYNDLEAKKSTKKKVKRPRMGPMFYIY